VIDYSREKFCASVKKSVLKDRGVRPSGKSCKLGDFLGDEMQFFGHKMQFFNQNGQKMAFLAQGGLTHFGGESPSVTLSVG
jgi:hypothetical protein